MSLFIIINILLFRLYLFLLILFLLFFTSYSSLQYSPSEYGSWLDSIALLLPIILLFLLLIISFLLLFSIELYSLLDARLDVIGEQWYWTYSLYSSYNWYSFDLINYLSISGSRWDYLIINYLNTFNSMNNYDISLIYNNYDIFGVNDPLISNGWVVWFTNRSLRPFIYLLSNSFLWSQRLILSFDSLTFYSSGLYFSSFSNLLLLSSILSFSFIISSIDIIHSFGIPSFDFKIDAIPGRLNTLFNFSLNYFGIFFITFIFSYYIFIIIINYYIIV